MTSMDEPRNQYNSQSTHTSTTASVRTHSNSSTPSARHFNNNINTNNNNIGNSSSSNNSNNTNESNTNSNSNSNSRSIRSASTSNTGYNYHHNNSLSPVLSSSTTSNHGLTDNGKDTGTKKTTAVMMMLKKHNTKHSSSRKSNTSTTAAPTTIPQFRSRTKTRRMIPRQNNLTNNGRYNTINSSNNSSNNNDATATATTTSTNNNTDQNDRDFDDKRRIRPNNNISLTETDTRSCLSSTVQSSSSSSSSTVNHSLIKRSSVAVAIATLEQQQQHISNINRSFYSAGNTNDTNANHYFSTSNSSNSRANNNITLAGTKSNVLSKNNGFDTNNTARMTQQRQQQQQQQQQCRPQHERKKFARIRNEEREKEEFSIPQGHVDTILKMYGTALTTKTLSSPASSSTEMRVKSLPKSSLLMVDLYKDVLGVSHDATDREIRIAYFRRGREILDDDGVSSTSLSGRGGRRFDGAGQVGQHNNNSETVKLKFQAVSMAYEILSTPKYKKSYQRLVSSDSVLKLGNSTIVMQNNNNNNNNNSSKRIATTTKATEDDNNNNGDSIMNSCTSTTTINDDQITDNDIITVTTKVKENPYTLMTLQQPQKEQLRRKYQQQPPSSPLLPRRIGNRRSFDDDAFTSSSSAVAAAFPIKTADNTTVNREDDVPISFAGVDGGGSTSGDERKVGDVTATKVENKTTTSNSIIAFSPKLDDHYHHHPQQQQKQQQQQQQQLVRNEFQTQSIRTPVLTSTIVKRRLPTALRRSSFISREAVGSSINSSTTSNNNDNNSNRSTSNKKVSKRTGTTASSASSSVRWRDHVEELVFTNHPNEHANSSDDSDSDSESDSDVDHDNDDDETEEDDDIIEEEERIHRQQVINSDILLVGRDDNPPKKKVPQNHDGSFPCLRVVNANNEKTTTAHGYPARSETSHDDINFKPSSVSEHTCTSNSYGSTSQQRSSFHSNNIKGKRKKKKPKIVIDSKELESHLKRIDSDAEKHFVKDFWDNFEESIDGIMSLVDSMGDAGRIGKFSTASSWLSSSSSMPSSSQQQQSWLKNDEHRTTNQTDTTSGSAIISRSMSHDLMSTIDESIEESTLQRSRSDPGDSRSRFVEKIISKSRQHTVLSPQHLQQQLPSSSEISGVITPDCDENNNHKRLGSSSSPYNAAAVVSSHSKTNTLSVLSPLPPASESEITTKSTISNSFYQSSTPCVAALVSPCYDTTTSLESSISSQKNLQQELFRPISPSLSEISDIRSSKDKVGTADDEFDLVSRISEMGSIDLSELDNPFRCNVTSSPSSPCIPRRKNETINDIAITTIKDNTENNYRVSISSEKEQPLLLQDQVVSKGGRTSSAESMEDVFAGVDEVETCSRPLYVQDISIERSASHVSDLSESVYTARKKIDKEKTATSYDSCATGDDSVLDPETEGITGVIDDPPTISDSVIFSEGKQSVLNSSAARSTCSPRSGASNYSSNTSTTTRDASSINSFDSGAVDDSQFFEYFFGYVTAIMTECAEIGTTTGKAAEYHQDFIGLFSSDASVRTVEVREQPSSVPQVPTRCIPH